MSTPVQVVQHQVASTFSIPDVSVLTVDLLLKELKAVVDDWKVFRCV